MSKIDYQALREAAEKATPGNWWIDSHGQAMVSFIDNEVLDVFVTDNKRDAVRHEDTGNLSRWRNDNDATFIATANPATVMALLDELETAKKRIAELSASHRKLRNTMAGIHNTIRMDGSYTPLAAILNAAKRAYEESASAAGIRIKGE
ncbi:ead/Ea22-like family protein [Escherichia coli]|uniref:ead/Ea22-like family protein n=1 Tax=Escherichia coli TaxID=562 RepID=UPI001E363546|nr:ead/Ea22-like family protein [Escherichia coli]MCC5019196.1 ead/Ea22-like family protein [Escherichia coli]